MVLEIWPNDLKDTCGSLVLQCFQGAGKFNCPADNRKHAAVIELSNKDPCIRVVSSLICNVAGCCLAVRIAPCRKIRLVSGMVMCLFCCSGAAGLPEVALIMSTASANWVQ